MKNFINTLKSLKYLIGFSIKHCPQMLIIDGLFGAVVALSTVLFIIMPKMILSAAMHQSETKHIVLLILIFALGELFCQYMLSFFSELSSIYNEKMAHDMLLALSEKATRIDYSDIKSNALIEKYQHAQNVSFQLNLYTAQLFCDFFSNFIKIITVIAVISTISIWMVGIILVIVFLKLIVADRIKQRDVSFQIEADKINVHYNYTVMLAGHLDFAKEMRCYGAENFIKHKFSEARTRRIANESKKLRFHNRMTILEHLLDTASVAVGYAMIVARYLKGAIEISMFTMYLTAIIETYVTVAELLRVIVNLNDTNRLLEQYMSFLQYPEKIWSSGTLKEIPKQSDGSFIFEFKNVSFRYPDTEQYALRDLNVTFRLGDRIGIIGENGAGKSTFVKLLLRLYDVDEGEILLNGINIRQLDYNTYLRLFSVVPQDFALFYFSVQENVGFERFADEKEKIERVLADVDLLEKLRSLPNGLRSYTSKWFQNGVDFSGGERQRIAIARAFFREAPIMVLDEPSAAIDPLAEEQIHQAINAVSIDKLVIHISHRLSMTKACNQILVFQNGSIIEKGSHQELMEQNGIYHQLFEMQAQYYVQEKEAEA
ncbi:ABC transporter ATP-binding protein [Ruminococcus sp.]|uniref:ABC transporter ATP-binding protein n=1 Tax=Ruminococcus sp. TaxID=41978 RepID=UPI002587110E|nr:ABC transporter ATP-binding protein [Ruminococcus sp.]MCR5020529.1 ABC transporter ATP-binding protein/permease [Ruminococcus sp.]